MMIANSPLNTPPERAPGPEGSVENKQRVFGRDAPRSQGPDPSSYWWYSEGLATRRAGCSTRRTTPVYFRPSPDFEAWEDGFEKVAAVTRATGRLLGRLFKNVERLVIDISRDSLAVANQSEVLYLAAADAAESFRATAKATPRLMRILKEATRIASLYRLHQTWAEIVGPERARPALSELHHTSATRVHALCIELRGPLLKLAQLVSSRPDLLPVEWVRVLSTLQDRVPPIPFEAIRAQVEAELGAPLETLFASFEPEAMAAASLAQVHGAVTLEGLRVAVKVQLPGVEELFEVDLTALRALGNVLGDLLPLGDVRTTVAELGRSIREELDFTREADNLRRFAACVVTHPGVRVPGIIESHSARRVLTLERIDGVRFTEFLDAAGQRGEAGLVDRDVILGALLGSVCRQALCDGLLHADPHPGNFLVVGGGDAGTHSDSPAVAPTLVILDFGAVQDYPPERRRAFAQLGMAILQDDPAKMIEHFDALGFRTASGDSASLVTLGRMFLEPFRAGAGLDAFDPEAQLRVAMAAMQADPVVSIPGDFVLLGRVFATVAGFLAHYRPRIDLPSLILPPLAAAL